MIEVKIPSPGESITEVEIASWLVEDGDYVEKDQELAEIESDKATLPLVAEESGKISIVASEGETIKVGEVACKIDTKAKPEASSSEKSDEKEETASQEEQTTSEKPGNVKESAAQQDKKQPTPEKEPIKEEKSSKKDISSDKSETKNVKITPVAEKMMEEYNLSIEDVMKGLRRLTKQDVEKAKEGLEQQEHGAEKRSFSREEERNKMSQLRRKLSQRLVSVKNETAMLTTFNEADMTEVMAIRKKYQKDFQEKYGIKLGLMSFFIKAAAKALEEFPNVNSRIEGDEVVYPEYKDIGIAVQTPKGLMVPNIRNAESLTIPEIEMKVNEFAEKAKKNRIAIDEMEGGTFTITNGGVFGSLVSTPIINPPQSGILGMHNIQDRPVAINGKVEIRPMMYIALSYDHRTIDGKDSVSFLVRIKELIEKPHTILLEGKNPDKALLGI